MPSSDPQDRFSQTVPDINHQVPKLLDARKLWSQLSSLFGACQVVTHRKDLVQQYLTFNVKFLNFWTPENFGHSLVHSLEPGDAE